MVDHRADYSRYQYVKVEKQEKIATVTLNRPEVLNAFIPEMREELTEIFEALPWDEEVNAVVLTGAGKAFSVGGDIKRGMEAALSVPPAVRAPRTLRGVRRFIDSILNLEQPIIAALNGDCIGQAACLALFCDIIVAAEGARIGDTHVRAGLVAGDGGAVIWPLLVGIARAKEFLLTGNLLTAREAERIGLINRVVPSEELYPTAMELARCLASGPPRAIRWTKMAVNKHLKEKVNLILDSSLAVESITMVTEDHREAVKAFLEKRKPHFTGL